MKKNITLDRLKEVLTYNPNTGIFVWKKRKGVSKKWNTRYGGKIAGCKSLGTRKGCCIRIDNNLYMAHRLAWFYIYGKWPLEQIDHINMNVLDNRIINLREANNQQNSYNRTAHRDNALGIKGVYFKKDKNKFTAEIKYQKKKFFLGYFNKAEDAALAYEAAAKHLHGEFARVV